MQGVFIEAAAGRGAGVRCGLCRDALSRTTGRPFFIHLQYVDLHHPNEPPDEYFEFFEVAGHGPRKKAHGNWGYPKGLHLDTPEFDSFRQHRLAVYDGCLRYVDGQIGRLLKELEMLGVRDDTLIVITSDHGEEFWDHAVIERNLGGDPRGFYGIGHGHSQFEELIRVPLIMAGPGVPRSDVQEYPASLLDIAPTILSRVGIEVPDQMKGINLLDQLPTREERVLISEEPAHGPDSSALIVGRWKFVSRVDGVRMLFDLKQDPLEQVDLAAQESVKIEEMVRLLDLHRKSELLYESAEAPAIDENTEESLRVLGYLE